MKLERFFQLCVFVIAGALIAGFSLYKNWDESRAPLQYLSTGGDLSQWGQWTESHYRTPDSASVHVFQRWSLSEFINSKENRDSRYPMQASENDLIRALAAFIPTLPDRTVIITDSCAGDLAKTHERAHNGWTFASLRENLRTPDFTLIPTFLPWKLELIFGQEHPIFCGEDADLLAQYKSVFSIIRTDLGEIRDEKLTGYRRERILKFERDLRVYDSFLAQRAGALMTMIHRFPDQNVVLIAHSSISRYVIQDLKADDLNFGVFEPKDLLEKISDSSALLHAYLKAFHYANNFLDSVPKNKKAPQM